MFSALPQTSPAEQTPQGPEIFRVPGMEPYTVTGKVVGVHDGDTATVLDENKQQHKIRFNGIDAPELKQDFGNRSKQNLSDLIFGKTVTVKVDKKDKYNRAVGIVFLDGRDINIEQIKAGLAWHYKKYASEQSESDRKLYSEAEVAAQNAKLGLWSQPNPTAPWAYRAGEDVKPELAGKIFGNKNTKVYHWAGCPGFTKLGEENRAVFGSTKEAESAGYRAAKNCSKPAPTDSTATVTAGAAAEKPETNPAAAPGALKLPGGSQPTPPPPPAAASPTSAATAPSGGKKDGRTYIKGSRGGCYYLSDSGKKVYVDRDKCQ